MTKKISLVTLIAFTVFIFSCTYTKIEKIKTVPGMKGKKVKVLEVVKTSGELIKFDEETPGRIVGERIVGDVEVADTKKHVSIPFSDVQWITAKKTKIKVGKTLLLVAGVVAGLSLLTVVLFINELNELGN